MMNIKLLAGLLIALPLLTVACSKKEAPAQEQAAETSTTEQAPVNNTVSADQQAIIDSIDQPDPEAIKVEGEDGAAPAEAAAEGTEAAQPEAETEQSVQ